MSKLEEWIDIPDVDIEEVMDKNTLKIPSLGIIKK